MSRLTRMFFLFLLLCAIAVAPRSLFAVSDEMAIDGSRCARRGANALALSFIGDIMAHTPNFSMDDYNRIYRGVARYFQSDDLTFANLEAPVNDNMEYRTYPRFNVRTEYLQAAIRNGVEVFSLANNHINDWGVASIRGTMQAFDALRRSAQQRRPVYTNGIRDDDGRLFTVQTIRVDNWRIGFVALTQFVNNADDSARYVQIVNYASADQVERLLSEIAPLTERYDLFVVSYHGGVEYRTESDDSKRRLFQRLADAGVDIVWGHHPHVLQPWEVYTTPTGRRAVLMHSLGNFVSGQTWFVPAADPRHSRAPTGDSVILRICLRNRAGMLVLGDVQSVPISHYKTPDGGVEVRTYRDLLRGAGITSEWQPYYRSRYAILQRQYAIDVEE